LTGSTEEDNTNISLLDFFVKPPYSEQTMQKWFIILFLLLLSACADSSKDLHEQFQNNDNLTVLDKKTKLMWAASDNRSNLTWQEATEYCTTYTGSGYEDWRMPKASELSALYQAGIQKDGKMITISGERIWASETEDSKGAFCHFLRSGCSTGEKVMSITMRALPVRDSTNSVAPATPLSVTKPQSMEQRLQVLDSLYKQNLLNKEEYDRKKSSILNEL
jgi:hypothetical protein